MFFTENVLTHRFPLSWFVNEVRRGDVVFTRFWLRSDSCIYMLFLSTTDSPVDLTRHEHSRGWAHRVFAHLSYSEMWTRICFFLFDSTLLVPSWSTYFHIRYDDLLIISLSILIIDWALGRSSAIMRYFAIRTFILNSLWRDEWNIYLRHALYLTFQCCVLLTIIPLYQTLNSYRFWEGRLCLFLFLIYVDTVLEYQLMPKIDPSKLDL